MAPQFGDGIAIRRGMESPDICNTDQGSPFTIIPFTSLLLDHKIAVGMDGRGA
jgi:hypothetical protein